MCSSTGYVEPMYIKDLLPTLTDANSCWALTFSLGSDVKAQSGQRLLEVTRCNLTSGVTSDTLQSNGPYPESPLCRNSYTYPGTLPSQGLQSLNY